jgi:D-alanyl-lipoteichoic acid acyltransferase DltB (MBOAT superfamily)
LIEFPFPTPERRIAMVFNSFEFLFFLAIVLGLYWGPLRRSVWGQNLMLLIVSYVFYGWWDWRFLSLLFINSMIDYFSALALQWAKSPAARRFIILISLVSNLGMLGFFKYYNFFADSLVRAFDTVGFHMDLFTLQVILPVGISFYTFQTLSYTLDVYFRKMNAVKDPVVFLAYVSFFPQLVAGPIERAIDLLPQFLVPRTVTWPSVQDGCRLALWGLFKKIVIADGVAAHVDYVFLNCRELDGVSLLIGAFFFSIQIYCDFSGYTDVGIGVAKLMGFELSRNFAYPYFSRNIAEFWRRWHMTLSTWFRDYLYIPLGGSRVSRQRTIINIVITFTLCGFWHGANWTFLVWGFLNGLMFIPLILLNRHQSHKEIVAVDRFFPTWSELAAILGTQSFVLLSWVFFRATSLSHAAAYLACGFSHPWLDLDYSRYTTGLLLCVGLLTFEWFQRRRRFALDFESSPLLVRYAAYAGIITMMVELSDHAAVPFIYFQF